MSLEQDLQNERVAHLDLSEYIAVERMRPIRDVIDQMRAEHVNCALIVDQGKLIGIFTDRDIVRRVVDVPGIWDKPIQEVMTPAPVTISPDASIRTALGLIHSRGFRNLPVIDESGNIAGNMTQYTLTQFLAERFPEEIYNLPPNPKLLPNARNGA